MPEWDADRDRAVDPDAGRITDAELARLRADIEWLRGKYGPPQPRDPQEGQLALPIDSESETTSERRRREQASEEVRNGLAGGAGRGGDGGVPE